MAPTNSAPKATGSFIWDKESAVPAGIKQIFGKLWSDRSGGGRGRVLLDGSGALRLGAGMGKQYNKTIKKARRIARQKRKATARKGAGA